MSERDNGVPAFPQINQWDTDRMRMGPSGMELRDYFAGKAMAAMVAHYGNEGDEPCETCARLAYEMADAMMLERSK
jgi:hypothetical protein